MGVDAKQEGRLKERTMEMAGIVMRLAGVVSRGSPCLNNAASKLLSHPQAEGAADRRSRHSTS